MKDLLLVTFIDMIFKKALSVIPVKGILRDSKYQG